MRVGVVIDSVGLEGQLDLAVLASDLADPETPVVAMRGLRATAVRHLARSERLDGLVIAGQGEEDAGTVAANALHAAGADRLAWRAVNLRELCAHVHSGRQATEKARLLLAAAVAMLRRYRWLGQASIRPTLGTKARHLSRRALLTLPMLRYEAVPLVIQSRCAASRGCNLCLGACPVAAIGVQGGSAYIQKERCRNCGLCLTACPAAAIDHPTGSRRILDAGLEAILTGRADIGDTRVATFACPGAMETLREVGRRRFAYPSAFLPLEVPCAAFVDWYLVLRAFDLGAAGVVILSCGEACPFGSREKPDDSGFSAVARLLNRLGLGDQRLAVLAASSAPRLVSQLESLFQSLACLPLQPLAGSPPTEGALHRYQLAELMVAVCRRLGVSSDFSWSDGDLPLGQARLNAKACTVCGLCADGCPTGALSYHESEKEARLMFSAFRCAGCGLCAAACPEAALHIARRLEMASLQGGTETLKVTAMARCQRCGQPFAAKAMLERILPKLGARELAAIARYCPDCRMIAAPAS